MKVLFLTFLFVSLVLSGYNDCKTPVTASTANTDNTQAYEFSADFTMITKSQSFDTAGIQMSDTKGYYSGTMYYFFIPKGYGGKVNQPFSYREMTFNTSNGKVKETFVRASYNSNSEINTVLSVKLSECNQLCYFKLLQKTNGNYYLEDKILYKRSSSGTVTHSDSYVESVVYDANGIVSEFSSRDGFKFKLKNVKTSTKKTEPDYLPKRCVSKDCTVDIDMVYSIDVSGSMRYDIEACRNMVISLASQFKVGTSQTSVALIAWAYKANLLTSTLDGIYNNGFCTNLKDFKNQANELKAKGDTCYLCGYKAAIETSYAQFLYEVKSYVPNVSNPLPSTAKNPAIVGRVILLMTDGYPNIVLHSNGRSFSVKKSGNSFVSTFHWSACEVASYSCTSGYSYNSNTYDLLTKTIKPNAKSFYSVINNLPGSFSNDEEAFFNRLTIIVLAVKLDVNQNMKNLFDETTQLGSVTAQGFKLKYTISSLQNANEMEKFYQDLSADVCSSFSGLADKCSDPNNDRLCCNGFNYCPSCDQSSNGCYEKNGKCDANAYCRFDNSCTSNDFCILSRCVDDPSSPFTDHKKCNDFQKTIWDDIATLEGNKYDLCNTYACNSSTKKFEVLTKADCYNLTGDSSYQKCPNYGCQINQRFYTEYSNVDQFNAAIRSPQNPYINLCIKDTGCSINHDCTIRQKEPNINSEIKCKAKGPNYSWITFSGVSACYALVPYGKKNAYGNFELLKNCKNLTCIPSAAENSEPEIEQSDFSCGNNCKKCQVKDDGSNDCVHTNEKCKLRSFNPDYQPSSMIKNCYEDPVCDSTLTWTDGTKGGCLPAHDNCAKDDLCVLTSCAYTYENGYDQPPTLGTCQETPVQCSLPSRFDEKCYNSVCINDKGGCFVLIDFEKLNDCGDCGDYSTCDESALVISAAIGAGVVAAIVVIAIVALSVGLIASKKMYDMITGANEARMDAASENQLYKSADKGGSNPLFD